MTIMMLLSNYNDDHKSLWIVCNHDNWIVIMVIGKLRSDIENESMIQEQLRIACEGTELVGLSPTTNNHTSNGTAIGANHDHIIPYHIIPSYHIILYHNISYHIMAYHAY